MIQKTSTISFKSTPLYDVKVKQKQGFFREKSVDAVVSVLDPKDKEDRKAVKKAASTWGKYNFVKEIWKEFSKTTGYKENFYTIELKGNGSLSERMIGICQENTFSDSSYIQYIQSKPRFLEVGKAIKGAGEVLIYGLVKQTEKRINCDKIELDSLEGSKGFYYHIGFIQGDPFDTLNMILPREDFKEYTSRIERKYGFREKAYPKKVDYKLYT